MSPKGRDCKRCGGRGMRFKLLPGTYAARVGTECGTCKGLGRVGLPKGARADAFDAFCLYAAGRTVEEL